MYFSFVQLFVAMPLSAFAKMIQPKNVFDTNEFTVYAISTPRFNEGLFILPALASCTVWITPNPIYRTAITMTITYTNTGGGFSPDISTVYMNNKTYKKAKKLGIDVIQIERQMKHLRKIRKLYGNKKNVVSKDIKYPKMKLKKLSNFGDSNFIKELRNIFNGN